MKRNPLIIAILLVLIIAAAIYFGLFRRTDSFGPLAIACGDTAELSYARNVNVLISVSNKCGDSLRVETFKKGAWQPLTHVEGSVTEIVRRVVNFDSGTVALVSLAGGEKIRFICSEGRHDSCRVTLTDFNTIRNFDGIYSNTGQPTTCNSMMSTRIFNFTTNVPMTLKINWTSSCGKFNGGVFTPSQPQIYLKENNSTKKNATGTVKPKAGGGFESDPFIMNGHNITGGFELFVNCPGDAGECRYTISVKK